MSVISDMVAYLRTVSGLTALVSTRIRPEMLTQGETYPAIAYTVIDQIDEYHLRGAAGLPSARVQFDAYATTYGGAEAVVEQLRLALCGYRGRWNSATRVQAVLVEDYRREGYDWPDDASQAGHYRAGMDIRIVFEQTPASLIQA